MPALIYPSLLAWALHLGGSAYWLLVPFNIVLVPFLDHVVQTLAPDWQPGRGLRRMVYAMPWVWLYSFAQLALLLAALHLVAHASLTSWQFMGLVSSTGLMTGTAGITAAHELIHRRSAWERALGLKLLAMVGYMHFRIEHVHGHHRHAATDHDPASARLGESFPAYFGRALIRGGLGAWRIERQRLLAQGKNPWSWRNRCVHYLAIETLIGMGIGLSFGLPGVVFFLLQALMAVHLLEAVNYVQHYGLRRSRRADGSYGRIGPQHAWDSAAPVSALLTFNLSTHAQHHLNAATLAERLQAHPLAPRLPLSFFLMVFLALIPPLWHRLMDARARRATGDPAESSDGLPLHAHPV